MRDQKVKEGEAEQKNEPKMKPQAATQITEVVVKMGQEFLRPIVQNTQFRRLVRRRNTTVSVEGTGQSRSFC